jgi:cryptochrome
MSSPSATSTTTTTGIHWFRNGLRLHDNPSLHQACRECHQLLPLVVLDPDAPLAQTRGLRPGAVRANFFLESLTNLNDKLVERGGGGGEGQGLVTVVGKPHVVLPQIVQCLLEHGGSSSNGNNSNSSPAIPIYYEQDVAAPVRTLDAKVWRALSNSNVSIRKFDSHTLHPMESYAALCPSGSAPPTYTGFGKIFRKLDPVPDEVPAVTALPPPIPPLLMDRIKEGLQEKGCVVHVGTVPTLLDVGYTHAHVEQLKNHARESPDDHLAGGEDAALVRLDQMMKRTTWVAQFEKPKTSPNALTFDTTGLSPCTFV